MRGSPESHGCIRMKNADVLDLFNRIEVGIKVYIHE
ncbi:MAG: L,D-transpeptidase [Methylobacter sp.]